MDRYSGIAVLKPLSPKVAGYVASLFKDPLAIDVVLDNPIHLQTKIKGSDQKYNNRKSPGNSIWHFTTPTPTKFLLFSVSKSLIVPLQIISSECLKVHEARRAVSE